MAKPVIRIDQATHSTTPTGTAGESRTDIEAGETVTAVDTTNNGSIGTHLWEVVGEVGGTVTLSGADTDTCTFTLQQGHTVILKKTFNGQISGEVKLGRFVSDQGGVGCKMAGGTLLLPRGTTEQFSDGWDDELEDQMRALDAVRRGDFSGVDQILAPDGMAGAPAIAFASAPAVGIYIAGGGSQLAFYNDGLAMNIIGSSLVQLASIRPDGDASRDLGTDSRGWKGVYLGEVASLPTPTTAAVMGVVAGELRVKFANGVEKVIATNV